MPVSAWWRLRHPMPYGNLAAQRVQRYATIDELDRYDITIEAREKCEPHLAAGTVIVIYKMDSASAEQVDSLLATIERLSPATTVMRANSRVSVDDPGAVAGKRVLVIEDGPTLTDGGMKFGAGVVAARMHGAAQIVDPRLWARRACSMCSDASRIMPMASRSTALNTQVHSWAACPASLPGVRRSISSISPARRRR